MRFTALFFLDAYTPLNNNPNRNVSSRTRQVAEAQCRSIVFGGPCLPSSNPICPARKNNLTLCGGVCGGGLVAEALSPSATLQYCPPWQGLATIDTVKDAERPSDACAKVRLGSVKQEARLSPSQLSAGY